MGLGKPKLCTKFEIVSFSRCRNIKGEAQNFGSSPSPGPDRLFLVGFDEGLRKSQLYKKFEVAGFIYYGNIIESVFKRQIRFLSYPLGELGITYGLYL